MCKLSTHESYSHIFKASQFSTQAVNRFKTAECPQQHLLCSIYSVLLRVEGRQVQLHLLFAIFILHSPPPFRSPSTPCLSKYFPALHFCASTGLPESRGQLNTLSNLKVELNLSAAFGTRGVYAMHWRLKQGLMLF